MGGRGGGPLQGELQRGGDRDERRPRHRRLALQAVGRAVALQGRAGRVEEAGEEVINTHFHWDHWQGNQVYAQGNPGLEIISSDRCKERLTDPNAVNGGTAFIEKQIAAMPADIARLKDAIQKAPDAATRASIEGNLAQAEAYLAELRTMTPPVPTRTVSQTVKLQEGGREIQLMLLGRGHTDGDLYAYLPKEKVMVTGDAVVDWMPFIGDGYPEEWIQTVAALERLDISYLIVGHGEPAPKSHLTFFRSYLTELVDAVNKGGAAGMPLEDMKKTIGDSLAAKYEAGFSKYPLGRYRDRVGVNVEHVYAKIVKKG